MTNGNRMKTWAGVIASVLAAATAWHQLGGWLPAGKEETARQIAGLEEFGKETRIIVLDDKLWERQEALSRLKRDIETYNRRNESAPGWMLQKEIDLERRIDRLQHQIERLEDTR